MFLIIFSSPLILPPAAKNHYFSMFNTFPENHGLIVHPVFPQHLCWGSPFLPSLSVSWSGCWKRAFPTPRAPGRGCCYCYYCCVEPPVFIFALGPFFWNPIITTQRYFLHFFYFINKKVIYNIGTEIIMPTSNLHNSTLRGPTETSLSGNYCKFYALSF